MARSCLLSTITGPTPIGLLGIYSLPLAAVLLSLDNNQGRHTVLQKHQHCRFTCPLFTALFSFNIPYPFCHYVIPLIAPEMRAQSYSIDQQHSSFQAVNSIA